MTALELEYMAVRSHLEDLREVVHDTGTRYEVGSFHGLYHAWDVAIAEIGAGGSAAAVEVERAVRYFRPSVALFVGVAGALKDAALGDVVVATKVYGYQSGKEGEGFYARPAVFNVAYRLEQLARAVRRQQAWKERAEVGETVSPSVHIAPIAAGDVVLSSRDGPLYKFIRTNYNDAVAIEMEAQGFLDAVHKNDDLTAVVVRGISDRIEGKTPDQDAQLQPVAARHAAGFAFELLHHVDVTGAVVAQTATDKVFLSRDEYASLLHRQGRL
jgi:nucleoside phosphorylase